MPGVRDDDLVERLARERLLEPDARVGLADELVLDPAAAAAERLAQPGPLRLVADEHRLAAHTGRAQQHPGDRLVAAPERADQDRDEDARRRCRGRRS